MKYPEKGGGTCRRLIWSCDQLSIGYIKTESELSSRKVLWIEKVPPGM